VLRGFGLKVGPTTPRTFVGRIRELVVGHPTLSTVAEALLAARSTLFEQWQQLEKRLRSLAREDRRVRLLITAPGVGAIVGNQVREMGVHDANAAPRRGPVCAHGSGTGRQCADDPDRLH
jgi:hypothetical protein